MSGIRALPVSGTPLPPADRGNVTTGLPAQSVPVRILHPEHDAVLLLPIIFFSGGAENRFFPGMLPPTREKVSFLSRNNRRTVREIKGRKNDIIVNQSKIRSKIYFISNTKFFSEPVRYPADN